MPQTMWLLTTNSAICSKSTSNNAALVKHPPTAAQEDVSLLLMQGAGPVFSGILITNLCQGSGQVILCVSQVHLNDKSASWRWDFALDKKK